MNKVRFYSNRVEAERTANRTKKYKNAQVQCVAINYDPPKRGGISIGTVHYWYVHVNDRIFMCEDGYWRKKQNVIFREKDDLPFVKIDNETGNERNSDQAHIDFCRAVEEEQKPRTLFLKGGKIIFKTVKAMNKYIARP